MLNEFIPSDHPFAGHQYTMVHKEEEKCHQTYEGIVENDEAKIPENQVGKPREFLDVL